MTDGQGRSIDYLRLSVTDRCNLRCVYCMPPEGVAWTPHGDILSYEEILRLCRLFHCQAALLKERSPSCGCGSVYDGTFTGVLTAGDGVTAELLRAEGIPVYGESRAEELLN